MIFVSHAWIDGKPDEKVILLVAKLRESGLDACCDIMFISERTSIHFKQMMAEKLQKSEKVIVVLSEEYKKKADLFVGGVGTEYKYILENIDVNTQKYILVSFRKNIIDSEIPDALRGREIISLDKDFDKLFYRLEDIPEYQFPEVNQKKKIVFPKKVHDKQNYELISEKCIHSIEIKSRTQEYANKWNRNMFLNNFDKRDEKIGINIKLKDVYLEEHLPNYIWNKNEKISKDLKHLLSEKIVYNNDKQMILVLGQPGIGKSTLITWITANFTNILDRTLVFQFAADLKNVDWQNVDKNYDIANAILNTLNLLWQDLEGKILILDGFDEIDAGSARIEIINQLYNRFIKESTIDRFSLIITCRENYILELTEVKCDFIKLQQWECLQIKSFCRIYQKKQIDKCLNT